MIGAARPVDRVARDDAFPAAPRARALPAVRAHWRSAALTLSISLTLLALLLVPRLSDLDALVTPDEPLWVGRSANFYQALSSGNLEHTYQYVHPGVPVMWLGALSLAITRPDIPDLLDGQINERNMELRSAMDAGGYSQIDILVDLRVAVTIFSALVAMGIFVTLLPLVGRWTAAAATAMIALDPLHIGYTRLLHLDGLSTNLLLLSVVAFCAYMLRHSRRFLIVSAVAAGVAILTRSANGVLAPLIAMLATADIALNWWVQRTPVRPQLRRYGLALAGWGLIAALTCFALWPALWVAPIDTLQGLWGGGLDLATDPHNRQVLWRGNVTRDDPGWLFYPIVLIYRMSPLAQIGLLLAAGAAFLPRSYGFIINRRLCFNLVLFASAYVVILSLAAKKLDRYALPTMVALDLVAMLGWVAFARWVAVRLTPQDARLSRLVTIFLIGVVLIGQGSLASAARPYYFPAASPVVGGTEGAGEAFSFGWGEGGKQIADALITIPGIEESRVVVGPWPLSIDFYLPFRTWLPEYDLTPTGAAQWIRADYVVVSAPEVQRQLYPPAMLDWFDQQTPLMVVMDGGDVYARIFDVRNAPLPSPFYAAEEARIVSLGESALLIGWTIPRNIVQDRLSVRLYFQGAGTAADLQIETEVVAADGSVVATGVQSHTIATGAETIDIFLNKVDLPGDLHDGRYTIRITFRDAATGDVIAAQWYATGQAISEPIELGRSNVAIASPAEDEEPST